MAKQTRWTSLFVEEDKQEETIPVEPTAKLGRCPQCDHGRFKLKLVGKGRIGRTCDTESGGCGYILEVID